jgi:uncharacterized membrane protein
MSRRDAIERSQDAGSQERYWEIDAFRGVAIVLMVLFHLSWDLVYFRMVGYSMMSGPWPWFARIIATMFLLAMGTSLTVSYHYRGWERGFVKYLWRGAKVFGLALVISAVTYVFLGHQFVVFGILHLIGFSIVVAYPLLPFKRRYFAAIVGALVVGIGVYINRFVVVIPWLIPLGVSQIGRGMADYYPVFPWFGVALLGVGLGHALYPGAERRFALPDWSGVPVIRELCLLGRHSLAIYMVHQPVLLGILYGISALSS